MVELLLPITAAEDVSGFTTVDVLPKTGSENEELETIEEPPVGPTTGELVVITTTTDEVLFGDAAEGSETEALLEPPVGPNTGVDTETEEIVTGG